MFPIWAFLFTIYLLTGQKPITDHTRVPSLVQSNLNSWVCCENVSFVVKVDGCYAQALPIDVARAVRRFKEAHCVQGHFEIWTCSYKEAAALTLVSSLPLKLGPD